MTTHRRAILRIYGPEIQQDTIQISQDAPLTVGRLDSNDLTLKHTKVSRNHCTIAFDGETLSVTDLGSSNGTLKGDQRLEANVPVTLAIAESITIGPFSLFFDRIEDGKPAKQPKPPAQPAVASTDPDAVTSPQQPAPQMPVVAQAPAGSPPRAIQPPPPAQPPATNGSSNGVPQPLLGVPTDASNWMQYLPEIYSDGEFFKRFLLIFEAGFAPYKWIVDNMDLYFDAQLAPPEWLRWFGRWVDIMVPANIPEERQHAVVRELGILFKARGTRKALSRHLELVFDAKPVIQEPPEQFSTFIVRLPLGRDKDNEQNRSIADKIIESHRPVHTRYQLIIE